MTKEDFLQEIAHRLRTYFAASKEGHKSDVERHRIEGFMEAGAFMNLSSYAEMNQLMEEVHFEVWGKTIKERKEDVNHQWESDSVDYSIYEAPAFDRGHQK